MILCLLVATIFFLASMCVVTSVFALILFMLGVCIFVIPFFLIDAGLIFALLFLAYSGFVVIMSLFTNDRKTSQKKYLMIASIPCAYIAYKIYSLNSSSVFSVVHDSGYVLLSDFSELLGLVSILILCGIFCICIALKSKHDIKKPPEAS